ncbi:MAG TPA: helix-turn-helix transcriptional regulator [Blastocatellia bacterium]|nr:helix-turn-helix transcriptional regulator [Blastocatellia bacterium]
MTEKVEEQTLGKAIRKARAEAGLSLRKLAGQLSKHPSYISDIENDNRVPSEAVLQDLSTILNINFDHLMALAGRLGEGTVEYVRKHPTAGVILRLISAADLQEEDLRKLLQATERICRNKGVDAKSKVRSGKVKQVV